MKKVAFYTLGCKLNFAESSGLSQQFIEKGYGIVDFKEQADIYVINTCTVTSIAEKKCRQSIQSAINRNPEAKIAVIGCFSQLRPEEIAKIKGVDYILGNADKHKLLDILEKDEIQNSSIPDIGSQKEFYPFFSMGGRTRSFFKIQDGCDNFCTYCAIPYARGRSRSNTVEQTVAKAKEIAASGAKEVILTGVNIGDFGRKNGETFYDLIQALDTVEGIERFRISSIEPDLLTDDIIRFVASSRKFMPHFHIPLQAGNDEVLSVMKRHYTRKLFAERVLKIKEVMPQAFIAADVIVGFPSETNEQFEDAYAFIDSLPLSALHVFTYSSRPNTIAANIKALSEHAEKAERSRRLHSLSDSKKEKFYKQMSQNETQVLWEAEKEADFMYGYSPNYIKVKAKYDANKANTLEKYKLHKSERDNDKDWVCY